MSVLICGGAGYIGSHTAALMEECGEDFIILDSLITGHAKSIDDARLYACDLRDTGALDAIFKSNEIDSIIDFAAFSQVGESMKDPISYYSNNVGATVSLLDAANRHGVKHFVFSSTAAVYGMPKICPITEDMPCEPINPYGQTKLTVERFLHWCDEAYGIKSVCLRYFNACGAHVSGKIGEDHNPESHLLPIVFQVALGQREYIQVFGGDYNTPDGTCVRDYIHVTDLADAHLLALKALKNGSGSKIYNLGNGRGFSVKEIIDITRSVTGKKIEARITDRRQGDPDILIASSEMITKELGWTPRFRDPESIIETAWKWHSTHPNGYGDK